MSYNDPWEDGVFAGNDTDLPSFFKVQNNKKELHTWLKRVSQTLIEQSRERTRKQKEHLLLYRGQSSYDNLAKSFDRNGIAKKRNRLVIPHIHDLTETRVSQMNRIKPTVNVLPAQGEWDDKTSAKIVEIILKNLWYTNNVDYAFQQFHRHTRIFGESYLFIDWDDFKGDLHPLYVKARDAGVKKVLAEDGSEIDVSKPFKTGDVKYSVELPWRVLLQRKKSFEEVEYFFRIHLIPTDILMDKYGKKEIKPTEYLFEFDMEELASKPLENHTMVFEFWHKETEQVPDGYHCLFTEEVILLSEKHPYSFKGFPFVRLTDLDVPEVLNGVSKYELIAPVFKMYDNINTLIAKNIWMTGAAKWLTPKNAAKIEALQNDNSVVEYQGAVPPKLAQAMPNPPEVYKFADYLLQNGQIVYGSHGVSRGDIPPGITATSALMYLNELESNRATTDISKHAQAVIDLAKTTVAVIGDKYQNDDERLIRLVGKNNQYSLRHFNTAHLHKAYDIRFDVGNGLPDTKTGKRNIILDMMQRNPEGNSMERWEELLEVGDVEKTIDLATAAVRAADSVMEDLAAGREVPYPEDEQDHIAHLQTYYKYVQSRQYKEEMPTERRKNIRDYIYWTEEIALYKAQKNPMFEAELAAVKLFPLFEHPTFPHPRSREQQMAVAQGAANATGAPAPGYQVPAQPLMEVKK